MIKLLNLCLLVFSFSCLSFSQNISFSISDEDFRNPERGLYSQIEGFSNNTQEITPFVPIDAGYLNALKEQDQSLVLRLYYIPEFVETPLSDQFLDLFNEDMQILRSNGFKCLLRFAYSREYFGETHADTLGASVDVMLNHIGQLETALQANKDVIAIFQAGFVGAYGEWASLQNSIPDFVNEDGIINLTNRKRVLDAILGALPADRFVQVRTPYFKHAFYYWDEWDEDENIYADASTLCPITPVSPLTEENAYNGTDEYRVAQHNDCFLASGTDFGTYCDDSISESEWLATETKYMPMGGESCWYNPPRSNCSANGGEADIELEKYHWSYLNSAFQQDVLSSWEEDGCMSEIRKKLGYRLSLVQGDLPLSVNQGCSYDLELEIENSGYAAPFNPRKVEVLLRNIENQETYFAALNDDPRRWYPSSENGNINISASIAVSEMIPVGNYELLIHLPDPEPSLYGLPDYSIRLANTDLWEPETGFNNTGRIVEITSDNCDTPSASEFTFIPFGCNAGEASIVGELCCEQEVNLKVENTSYFADKTIAWAVSDDPITEIGIGFEPQLLEQRGNSISIESFCSEYGEEGKFITPYLAVNDHTYNYVFPDTLQGYWASSQTISLDLTNEDLPYDIVYGAITTISIYNLNDFFNENGGNSTLIVDPTIGETCEQFNIPTLAPGQPTATCSFASNPNTNYNLTIADNTAGIGGVFIVTLKVEIPFPSIHSSCSNLGASIFVAPEPGGCCESDLNNDFIVNVVDLLLFLEDFGCTSNCNADFNSDGETSGADLLVFISQFGISCN